jgi:hypothetical protein
MDNDIFMIYPDLQGICRGNLVPNTLILSLNCY